MSEPSSGTVSLSQLESNVAFGSDNAANHGALADAYVERKRWDDAVREYRRAMSLQPDEPLYPYGLGQAYLGAGEDALAEEAFRGSIALSTGNPASYFSLGELYERQGRRTEAEQAYELCLKFACDPEQMKDVRGRLARLFPGRKEVVEFYKSHRSWRYLLVGLIAATLLPPLALHDGVAGAAYIVLTLLIWRVTTPAVYVLVAALIVWPVLVVAESELLTGGTLTFALAWNVTVAVGYLWAYRRFSRLDLNALYQAGNWPAGRAAPTDDAAAPDRFAAAGAALAALALGLAPALLVVVFAGFDLIPALEWETWDQMTDAMWGTLSAASSISCALGAAALAGRTRRKGLAIAAVFGGAVALLTMWASSVIGSML